tara:strand:- start:419 stop:685 length:267 start_codon:yes stop_codon:yes gene_type:complete
MNNNNLIQIDCDSIFKMDIDYLPDISINDTYQDRFLYEIDNAIQYGDINYIRVAIQEYKNLIDISYINWANNIAIQLLEEQMEDVEIK